MPHKQRSPCGDVARLLRRATSDGQNDRVAERVRVREIDEDEGRRLLRIIRRGTGSVVTWRRAQMVLLSAQGMPVAKIAEVTFTSADRIRDVIHNFNADGFDSLYPKYKGGRPKTFTLPERREIKKIAKSRPAEHDLPFSTWSLAKLAEFPVAEGVVDDISHEGLRLLLREEGIDVEIVERDPGHRGFRPQPKRWRVGQTYGILILHRRLVRDYEHRTASSASSVYWAMSHVMVRRLTGANTSSWREEALSA